MLNFQMQRNLTVLWIALRTSIQRANIWNVLKFIFKYERMYEENRDE